MTIGQTIAAFTQPEQLYELLDPDTMWYSADVDSSRTCNSRDDVIACIERNLTAGMTGRFEVLAEHDEVVVVQPVLDPPRTGTGCLLVRFRDEAIVELRDFVSPQAALAYAGIVGLESRP